MERQSAAATLRDRMALENNALANERTFLAYIRTALSFLAVGVGTLKFLDTNDAGYLIMGWGLILAGLVTLPIGGWRYWRYRLEIQRQRKKLDAV